jgi:hypothetical protein
MNGECSTQRNARPSARRHSAITEIAVRHLGLDSLDERGSDRDDFHDLSVGSIRAALEAAYAAGAASATGKAVRS